jgi:hypothetical protein
MKKRLRSLLGSPVAWTLVATATSLLIGSDSGASDLWWLLPGLFAAYLLAWGVRRRATGRAATGGFTGWSAWLLHLTAGVAGAVAYEATLSTAPGNFGGLHPDTTTSFALLPGFLVPALALTSWVLWRYALDPRQFFFLTGLVCWWEMLTVGGLPMLTQPWLAPLLVAFYVASYAVYCGAFGPLLVAPGALWSATPRPITRTRIGLWSVAISTSSWLCFGVWGTVIT